MVYIVALLVGTNNATTAKCRHKSFSMMRLDEAAQLKKWI